MNPLAHSHLPKFPRSGKLLSRLAPAWPRIAAATTIALVLSWVRYATDLRIPTLSPVPFTIMGVAISIFLGFRNNTAYDRFWEARTLWGTHINSSRTFARQVMTLIVADDKSLRPFQEDVVMATIAYAHSFKNLLQDDDPMDGVDQLMLPSEIAWLGTQKNVPLAILHLIGRRLGTARSMGWIPEGATIMLETTLKELTSVQGGCERIKNTPIPETYGMLSRLIVTFFCLFLPFGILDAATWLTPVVVFFVSYAFHGLDTLGDEVTEPFGHDPHDLPLEKYTETIEINLRQILSDRELPPFDVENERPQVVRDGVVF